MISRTQVNAAYPLKALGEIVDFLDSKRRPVAESLRRPGAYPYYGANGQQGTIDGFIFDEPLVLLAEDGGTFGLPDRSIAYRISGKTWVNNHAHVLRPLPVVDAAYLCRVLENYDVTPFVTGTTRGKLTKSGAAEIPIPIPPLVDQQRIADVLDRADVLRAERRAALAHLDALSEAVFLEHFRTPEAAKWPELPIASLAHHDPQSIRTGPFGSQLLHSEFVESGIAVLGIDNVVQNEFVWARPRFITDRKYRKLQRYTVRPGDLLITIMGTCGRCAVVPEKIPVAINTKHLCCISLDRGRCLPSYLKSCLIWHPKVLHQLGVRERGAVVPGLNMQIIKELSVPIPPLEVQSQLVLRLNCIAKLTAVQRDSLAELDALFASLQHRAFRGEL